MFDWLKLNWLLVGWIFTKIIDLLILNENYWLVKIWKKIFDRTKFDTKSLIGRNLSQQQKLVEIWQTYDLICLNFTEDHWFVGIGSKTCDLSKLCKTSKICWNLTENYDGS